MVTIKYYKAKTLLLGLVGSFAAGFIKIERRIQMHLTTKYAKYTKKDASAVI